MNRNNFSHAELKSRVREMITHENMLSMGDSVLIGLSGGADSVALFRLFLELREEYDLTISCAHVHHGLRGETARRDMEFAKKLCQRFGVPLAVLEEDVKAFAKKKHLSVEDAGRQVRYAFFKQQNTSKIAVAHTKDDNAETILMNLIKGNLPMGIAPCRENIIRPLLNVTKQEIYGYLAYLNQDFVTDETNFTTDYTRNKIRLELIPYLEEHFNKNFTNTVYHSSRVLYREQRLLKEQTEEIYLREAAEQNGFVILSLKGLQTAGEALAKRIIRHAYYRICPEGERISYEQSERVFVLCIGEKKGKQVTLPGGIVAFISGDSLVIKKAAEAPVEPMLLMPEQEIFHQATNLSACLSKTAQKDAKYCYPIRVKAKEEVILRQRREGDKLYFHNIRIHKKLSDFFIDKKIPLHERDLVLLVCVNGSVRVVVGHFYEEVTDCPEEELYYIILK